MIHTNRIVTVGEQESIIDRPIVLYRGDREVEIEFTLVGNEFMFSEEGNIIKSVNASHGQLVLNTPSGEHMFSELAECHEGKVIFVVTKEMIDEFVEVGFYSFQIRLYDSAEMKSRVTIPPVMNGFDIRNPIAAEDETNVVDQGLVDYARVFKDQSNEELPTFDWTGAYNKTEWAHHDVITENKLNKIEDALYSINADTKKFDAEMRNTLNQVTKDADAYVKEHIAEVEQDVEDFERNINTGVEQFKIDTNAAITAHKNEVSEELESVNTQLEDIISKRINVKSFGAVGDGITDDTDSVKEAINQLKDRDILEFPVGQYLISSGLVIEKTVTVNGGGTLILGDRDFDLLELKGDNSVIENIIFKNTEGFTPSNTNVFTKGCAIHVTGNNCVVEDNKIDNFVLGIMFGTNGGSQYGCTIENNLITNLLPINTGFPNDGILTMVGGCIITNNKVFGKFSDSYASRAGICCDLNGTNCIVSNNFIDANNAIKVCIHVERSPYSLVSSNQCKNPKWQGITTSNYCTIEGNYVETPSTYDESYVLKQSGIFANGCTDLSIINNTIVGKNNSCLGVSFSKGSNHIISQNSFLGTIQQGVLLHIASNSLITCNSFNNSVSGSNISSSGKNNSFIGNQIKGGDKGIVLGETSENSFISGNVILNTVNEGIRLYNTTEVTVANNIISDNKDTPTQNHGITINNVGSHKKAYLYNNIIKNTIIGNIEYGSYSGNVFLTDLSQINLLTPSGSKATLFINDDKQIGIE